MTGRSYASTDTSRDSEYSTHGWTEPENRNGILDSIYGH